MAVPGVTDIDTRYITTYSQDGLEGYLVRVPTYPTGQRADRRWHGKLFAFKRFASTREALLAAAEYRDKWYIDHEHDMRLRPVGTRFGLRLPRNNTSGIIGVNRTERAGKSGPIEMAIFKK